MKKILLVFLMLAFISPLCFAQQPVSAAAGKDSSAAAETKTLTGKVESVTLGDSAKGTGSEIVVSENDQKTTFLLVDTTTFCDAAYNGIPLEKITKGQTVKVRYSTGKDGVNKAVSIILTGK